MRRLWLIFSQAATVGMALLFVVATLKPQWLSGSSQPFGAVVAEVVSLRTAAPAAVPASGAYGLADAARQAAPAVVSVVTNKARSRNPHADDPAFGFFYGNRDPASKVWARA